MGPPRGSAAVGLAGHASRVSVDSWRMWSVLARVYARRVVNVNVNIILAGALALLPVLGILKICEHLDINRKLIPAVTFLADVVCDVAIYYVLHWLANHAGRPARPMHTIADATVDHVPFFRDATKVQFQRAVLSPLLYGIWLGTQWVLIHHEGLSIVWATTIGFVAGVGTARVLHTLWMVKEHAVARRAIGPPGVVASVPASAGAGATERSGSGSASRPATSRPEPIAGGKP